MKRRRKKLYGNCFDRLLISFFRGTSAFHALNLHLEFGGMVEMRALDCINGLISCVCVCAVFCKFLMAIDLNLLQQSNSSKSFKCVPRIHRVKKNKKTEMNPLSFCASLNLNHNSIMRFEADSN